MACIQVPSASAADSEMEEGEIIDDVDELSDISSEEEFLLRQRLQVLENYNNVLERKKAKTTVGSGKECERAETLHDLSEISGTDVDDGVSKEIYRSPREQKQLKPQNKHRKFKQTGKENGKLKEHKKKNHHYRKKNECKVLSETSEESDDEYRNKRRKLANAVSFNKDKSDVSTLKERLTKMMCSNRNEGPIIKTQKIETERRKSFETHEKPTEVDKIITAEDAPVKPSDVCDLIDLCTDDDTNIISTASQKSVDAEIVEKFPVNIYTESSDEDIELLRQHALQTKASKASADATKLILTENKTAASSEDEDSDTSELRMICLKSALLKKAIEMKQKQKLQKRLSQCSNIHDEFDIAPSEISNDLNNCENNTDVESVDMDIGSDGDDKGKDFNTETVDISNNNNIEKCISENKVPNEEEIEEDEDLLRAKLLTSLSKNLPNLVDLNVINTVFKEPNISNKKEEPTHSNKIEEKKFIIRLGESDSEGEHEATKNLTKMHHKLSEQEDFQKKLDLFLKSSRMQVEQKLLPDIVQPPSHKVSPKFVPKAMKHLPKSEQIEYKNLVKRMAELEKMKQVRQIGISLESKTMVANETLKPHNITLDAYKVCSINKLEEKIAMSRKKIAEESAKMLKLKEEAQKLSQKYKITATELRNITTAITFNKKQQRNVQNGLFKVRLQHQMLLKSSPNLKSTLIESISKSSIKAQKENNPSTKEHRDPNFLKTVKVSVVNDLNKNATVTHPRLSVQVDIENNKKTVKMPKVAVKERLVDSSKHTEVESRTVIDVRNERLDDVGVTVQTKNQTDIPVDLPNDATDYKSPLEALKCRNWEEDPNAFLCPYEIGGSCRDPDCKYLHPEIPPQQ